MRKLVCLLLSIVLVVLYSCGNSTGQKENHSEVPTELKILNERIQKDSTNAYLWNARANYFLKNKDVNRALSDLNKAILFEPDNAIHFITLSDIYLTMGDASKCMSALLKANNLESDNIEALQKLAEINLIFKNYELVFEYLNKALALDKSNPTVYFMRGFAYAEIGDTANAIINMQLAVDRDQEYYEAFLHLGLFNAALGNEIAEGYYDNAVRIRPESIEALYAKAMYHQDNSELDKAIDLYQQIVDLDPLFVYSYYNLGYIYLVYLEEPEKATEYLNKVIELKPEYVDAYVNRGYSYELQLQYIRARNDYQMVLKIDPNHAKAIEGMNRLDGLMK